MEINTEMDRKGINLMDYKEAGLTRNEYETLKNALDREPNKTELLIMGVMWSEHCCYKSTRNLLSMFPAKGKNVVAGPGENAGIVDIGDGLGLAFKVESHNHPSAVAPFQGAATGVGGIIRDIITLGARPVASLDGLFFGDISKQKTRNLADGVVKGIGGYGNPVGVPTIGGKTFYSPRYAGNPLVNAMCLGLVEIPKIISSKTAKAGQLVVLLGSKTGRDGIAGAAFASTQLAEDTKTSRPNIQIGDPFVEKLLIEACIELRDKDLIVSMQDMGAAGITSSSSEIAAKSKVGMILDFEKVPLRENDMEPWEIALSESQERMLLIARPEDMEQISEIAQKWDLDSAVIGHVTENKDYLIRNNGKIVADIPASLIGDGCPSPEWKMTRPASIEKRWNFDLEDLPENTDMQKKLLSLLKNPGLSDKGCIYEQYDSMVQTNTVTGPGNNDTSVIRVKGTEKLIAISMEADPWKCDLDPYRGATETVGRSIRSLAVAGAEPLGMTNCLNFASPEKPDQYWVLNECVKGMADFCKQVECPVISGNVSLYNETINGSILPTPLVGIAGLISMKEDLVSSGKWQEGDHIYYAGMPNPSLAGSYYQLLITGGISGRPLPFTPEAEQDFLDRAVKTAKNRLVSSGRTIKGGGLLVTLAKECIASEKGAAFDMNIPTRKDVFLFGEGGPRAIYSVPRSKVVAFKHQWNGFPVLKIGEVRGDRLLVNNDIDISVVELTKAWRLK